MKGPVKHIEDARCEGFTIDYSAAGRPIYYSGPRFQPRAWGDCFTELETKLVEVLRAIVVEVPPHVFVGHVSERDVVAKARALLRELGEA